MKEFIEKHPLGLSWFLLLLQVLVGGGYGWVYNLLDLRASGMVRAIWDVFRGDLFPVAYTSFYTLLAVLIIAMLNKWRESGFVSIGSWKDLRFYIIPTLLTFLILIPGISPNAAKEEFSLLSIAFYLLLGFREEAFNRGLIQNALARKGAVYAVFMSAVFFGLLHTTNLFFGRASLLVAGMQVLRAIAIGIGYGALLYKFRSIYPLMILHALTDIFTMSTNASINDLTWFSGTWYSYLPGSLQKAIVFELPSYLMAIYGIYLLRRFGPVDEVRAVFSDVKIAVLSIFLAPC